MCVHAQLSPVMYSACWNTCVVSVFDIVYNSVSQPGVGKPLGVLLQLPGCTSKHRGVAQLIWKKKKNIHDLVKTKLNRPKIHPHPVCL